MCGRYALYDFDELYDEYAVPEGFDIAPNYNAAPTQTMPVITQDGIQMMRWGLIPSWAKDEKIGYKLFNARSESVFEKAIWKPLIMRRRCLVPANGFYEWQRRDDEKQPYFIHINDSKVFMFAGVWEMWKHKNLLWNTYSILTTKPNNDMVTVHDRMPVILHKDDHSQWLHAATQADIEPLLVPYEDGHLTMFEVSREVNTTRTNDQSLVLPINSQ
jgi:putative SOS response-associated peptidase YedK